MNFTLLRLPVAANALFLGHYDLLIFTCMRAINLCFGISYRSLFIVDNPVNFLKPQRMNVIFPSTRSPLVSLTMEFLRTDYPYGSSSRLQISNHLNHPSNKKGWIHRIIDPIVSSLKSRLQHFIYNDPFVYQTP